MSGEDANFYVYVYIDPRNFREFYYGKGRGARSYSHLDDKSDSKKMKIISEIKSEGLEPIIRVIASRLTEAEAFLVEKTLIWKLGHGLTNISGGHFAEHFRPMNTLHREVAGFDFQNDIVYVNVGEGDHRCWEDCRNHGFLSAGQGIQWSNQIRRINDGDIVVAYLKNRGYVGVGLVKRTAVRILDFRKADNSSLRKDMLREPRIFENAESLELSEYLLLIDWIKVVQSSEGYWRKKAGLFSTQLVTASLANQPKTLEFLESCFCMNFADVRR